MIDPFHLEPQLVEWPHLNLTGQVAVLQFAGSNQDEPIVILVSLYCSSTYGLHLPEMGKILRKSKPILKSNAICPENLGTTMLHLHIDSKKSH